MCIRDRYYVPNNSVISICGNFNFEEIVEKIKDKFKTWEAKEASINTTCLLYTSYCLF